MRAWLARLAVVGMLTLLGCGGGASTSMKDGAVDAPADSGGKPDVPAADKPSGDGSGDVPADAPVDTSGADQRTDQATDKNAAGDAPTDIGNADVGGSCVTQTIVLARGGTTSSCSFKVAASIPRDRVNLTFGGRLCEQGSNNCTPRGGWFWFGDEVALCDATCLVWENSGANLVLEIGCPSESCFVACHELGGTCGDGINGCCAGWRCTSGTCAACAWGGQACTATGDCCSGTCKNGACIDGIGGTCASQAGCSAGVCRDGRCQCATDQILCNSGCVSYTDPNNCRGCGNVCPTGTGRVCTAAGGCVCDPQSALPDECNGTCVNKATDRTNCGACFNTCGRLDQVCNNGVCGCPSGQTDCNGGCNDTRTSQTHCGTCNHSCPPTTEMCSAGTCVCAPGLTRCPSGACVNLQTDRFNCSACGMACNGNKTCSNGTCG